MNCNISMRQEASDNFSGTIGNSTKHVRNSFSCANIRLSIEKKKSHASKHVFLIYINLLSPGVESVGFRFLHFRKWSLKRKRTKKLAISKISSIFA